MQKFVRIREFCGRFIVQKSELRHEPFFVIPFVMQPAYLANQGRAWLELWLNLARWVCKLPSSVDILPQGFFYHNNNAVFGHLIPSHICGAVWSCYKHFGLPSTPVIAFDPSLWTDRTGIFGDFKAAGCKASTRAVKLLTETTFPSSEYHEQFKNLHFISRGSQQSRVWTANLFAMFRNLKIVFLFRRDLGT